MSRFVLLKEFPANLDVEQVPDDDYVKERHFAIEKKPFRIRTDTNGFILPGDPLSLDPYRIVAIGDSVCENLYVDEHRRIWSVLSALLSHQLKSPVEVLNGGVSGNHLLHVINLVLNKLLPLRPTALIFLGGAVDRIAATDQQSYWSQNPKISTLKYQLRAAPSFSERHSDFTEMRNLFTLLCTVCETFQIPFIAVTVPFPQGDENDYFAMLRQSNEVIREVCTRRRLPLVELQDLFGASSAYTYDAIHLNELGSALVAEAIFSSGKLRGVIENARNRNLSPTAIGV